MRLDLLNWFQQKHINYQSINQPLAEESQQALQQLGTHILLPLEKNSVSSLLPTVLLHLSFSNTLERTVRVICRLK
ncbi:MAG: hypothetical protein ACJAYB_002597 [Psychromonas sp.]|jgi:hypothetical protein